LGPLGTTATNRTTVPAPGDWWNDDWQGKQKYSEKTCPNAVLSITNPYTLCPEANPGRRGWKPKTNRLSYGTAIFEDYRQWDYLYIFKFKGLVQG
jgi:hypothetical protein